MEMLLLNVPLDCPILLPILLTITQGELYKAVLALHCISVIFRALKDVFCLVFQYLIKAALSHLFSLLIERRTIQSAV